MGSPLSPIIADLVMQRLERNALIKFNNSFPFYYRYVDDICTAVPTTQIEYILNCFNSFHPKLQHTIEIGDDILNFLNITIKKANNSLEFDWYLKQSCSGRYLNYFSDHLTSQKRGNIGLVDRVLLSDEKYHKIFNI